MKTIRSFATHVPPKDYYSILGLSYGAASKEIRSAYLSLAKKYHPDAPTGNTEKFKQIAEAYEILNDPRNKTPASKPKNPSPPAQNHYYQHQDDPFSHQEENSYKDWADSRQWSYSSREQNFESKGYEYYDPFLTESERYTYSKFKRDRYNKTYKEPEKNKEAERHNRKGETKSGGSGIIGAVGAAIVFAVSSALRSPSPQSFVRSSRI